MAAECCGAAQVAPFGEKFGSVGVHRKMAAALPNTIEPTGCVQRPSRDGQCQY